MHCEGFPPLFISFVAQFHLSLYPLALGAAESRDGITTKHSVAGQEQQCLHTRCEKSGIYTHRHVYILLNVFLNNVLSV